MTELKIRTPYETHRFKYDLLVSDVVSKLKEVFDIECSFTYQDKEVTIIPYDVLIQSTFEIYETK